MFLKAVDIAPLPDAVFTPELRKLREEYAVIATLDGGYLRERAYDDFETILRYPEVRHIATNQNRRIVMFTTTPVTLRDTKPPHHAHLIGEFVVTLYKLGANSSIHIKHVEGRTRSKGEDSAICCHPHIVMNDNTTTFCLGTLSDALSALREGRLHETIRYLLDGLWTYGPGIPYCDIKYWPRAEGAE